MIQILALVGVASIANTTFKLGMKVGKTVEKSKKEKGMIFKHFSKKEERVLYETRGVH